jgi:transposase
MNENGALHRHDMVDALYAKLEPRSPGGKGKVGRPAENNRKFLNAVLWILRTGAPWRDLPPEYGDWKNVHRRFCRWRDNGVWENLLDVLREEPDYEWIMIDATFIKCHPHSAGAVGGNQEMSISIGGSTPRYIWPWMRLVCRSESLLQMVPQMIVHRLHSYWIV